MNRDKRDEQFIPETVDEQVETLLQMRDQHYFRTHPNARLTHDLAITHQEDKQILEHAWQRLATHPSVIQAPAYPPPTQYERTQHMYPNGNRPQQPTQTPGYPPSTQYERTQHMYPNGNRPQRRQGRQGLAVLVASLFALLLVGSSLAVFAFLRLPSGQTSTTQTPTTNATSLATHSPALSPTAIPQVQTSCPAVGTARVAVMPPLSTGNHQGVLYVSNSGSTGLITSASTTTSILSRYDVASGQRVDLLKVTLPAQLQNNQLEPAISKARLSSNGQWIVFQTAVEGKEAIQLMRADGQELQTLYCTTVDKDFWDALSFSPDAKYITFEEVFIQGGGNQNLMLLDLATGKLHVAAQVPGQQPAIYEPIKWRDNTSLYVNYSRIGVGDTRNRKQISLLPDVTQNSTPQQISIPTISGASNDNCKDFDFSPDNTQLLVSDCHGGFMGEPVGPSTIEIVSLAGGSPRIVHNSRHAIVYARFITNTTVWFSVSDNTDPSQNGVWKINTDGTGLTRLTTEATNFENLAYSSNMHISPDGASFVFLGMSNVRTSITLVIGSMNGGNTSSFDTGSPSTSSSPSIVLIGWTTF